MQNPVFYWAFIVISWINPRSAITNYTKGMRSVAYVTRPQTHPGGVLAVYMTGGVRWSFILRTQKNTWAWNFTPKKIPGIKIFYPKEKQEYNWLWLGVRRCQLWRLLQRLIWLRCKGKLKALLGGNDNVLLFPPSNVCHFAWQHNQINPDNERNNWHR